MTRFRLTFALLAALLSSPVFAQDITNPACNGPWTNYAATATAQTPGVTPPTLSVASSRYKLCGNKTVMLEAAVNVTAAGTGSGAIRITLPFTAAAFVFTGSSYEYTVTGNSGAASIGIGSTFASATNAVAATSYIVTGQGVAIGITYEIP